MFDIALERTQRKTCTVFKKCAKAAKICDNVTMSSTKQQNARKQSEPAEEKTRTKMLLAGAGLLVGWTIVLGVTTLLHDLPCILSPQNCSGGEGPAQILLFAPLIVGSALIPAGMFYGLSEKDFPRPLRVFAAVPIMGVLLFLAFWAITYIGIATRGLG